ncbi:metallo-beta-lactamase [Porphyromonas crevioricanis]|uniref:Metallo-beta-lactamase n=1 Tax=Porphyromonas crevioricanis TaxID=393921 RepID=A0AB34PIW3_9PORP|nr:MBL fold metallo-hydrolase [Porphyromonas crevioricanis]KGN90325.1 metallo-beta-lactamase [Porphyromonas crevioricanis]KGN95335.1 metallo-beta-lactamase [Porphyromonas crevioricanis]
MIRFMSLASGSSGNCYYLETPMGALLIDTGINVRTIAANLKTVGVDLQQKLRAILLTHDHADHIRSIGRTSLKYELPIYATEAVFAGIDKSRYVVEKPHLSLRHVIDKETPFELIGLRVTPFDVPHDASDNVGYYMEGDDDFRFCLLTDVGHITPTIRSYAGRSKHLVVEANYDSEMLIAGPYPDFLKQRVSGPRGHLSNQTTADFLAEVFTPEMENIWLCHLSKDNNHPELCWKTIENRLFYEGIRVGKDVSLTALARTRPSPLYVLQD